MIFLRDGYLPDRSLENAYTQDTVLKLGNLPVASASAAQGLPPGCFDCFTIRCC